MVEKVAGAEKPMWPCRVSEVRTWGEALRSVRFERPPGLSWKAGQCARVGLREPDGSAQSRPYSIVSAPSDDFVEIFFSSKAPGPLSPRLAALGAGASLLCSEESFGNLTADAAALGHEPAPGARCGRKLLLLAGGTGCGAFLAGLRSGEFASRFESVALVRCSSRAEEAQAYDGEIERWARSEKGFARYETLTREKRPGFEFGSIGEALGSGALGRALGWRFDPKDTSAMVCGGKGFVEDLLGRLAARGFEHAAAGESGSTITEAHWFKPPQEADS